MNWYKRATGAMYFLRMTNDPEGDLKRNFSCYNPSLWVKDKSFASTYIERLRESGNDEYIEWINPKYDPINNVWCLWPEKGISSFAFNDEGSFNSAKNNVFNYEGFGGGSGSFIAVFESSDYDLGGGVSDMEDLFRDGRFIGYIPRDISYENFIKRVSGSNFEIVQNQPNSSGWTYLDDSGELDKWMSDMW